VDPATFFDHLPAVMKQVPPLPGEESLYKWIASVLDAPAKDPAVMQTLRETALAADQELVAPMMRWRFNGQRALPMDPLRSLGRTHRKGNKA
jgi:hypothetical protein